MARFDQDRNTIIRESIQACLPDQHVQDSLKKLPEIKGKRILIAVGKAGWRMAKAALEIGYPFDEGIVITKYGHAETPLPGIQYFEAGHPNVDENSVKATDKAIAMVQGLGKEDGVIFLLSGGGSSLFEKPRIPLEEAQEIYHEILRSGADIREFNIIRKHLSQVKGGQFAKMCAPAMVYSIIISDVLDNAVDMIASGPTVPDTSSPEDVQRIIDKYQIKLSDKAKAACKLKTCTELDNVKYIVSSDIRQLCQATAGVCESLGYETKICTTSLDVEARQAGEDIGRKAVEAAKERKKQALIFGGETVVKVKGNGKGGRNQELALAAAEVIDGHKDLMIFSIGSDGTDGPTDAAGGFVDGWTKEKLKSQGISIREVLEENNSYYALKSIDQLIFTGPTGTNINDVSVALIDV